MSAEQRMWKFLVRQGGYYCEECLAERVGVSVDEIRRRPSSDFVALYRLCHGCHCERRVIALRPGGGLYSSAASIMMQL